MPNTIEKTVKYAGLGRKKAMQKQIDVFVANNLMEDEELLGVAVSHPKPTEQIYITGKRVIVHKVQGLLKNETTEIPLNKISSINISTGKFLSANIKIFTSNNEATVENVPLDVAQDIKQILDQLVH